MLYWLRRYFGFNKREIQGMVVLWILIMLVWVAPIVYDHEQIAEPVSYTRLAREMQVLENRIAASKEQEHSKSNRPIHYFKFDPNGLAVADWKKLGLRDAQISNIKHYEAKGGRFLKKEDLRKMYSLSQADYERLAPYIVIKKHSVPHLAKKASALSTAAPQIDLNQADSTSLLDLPGIGPVFASRIVRYRKLLGGFYALEQLLDVYGMDTVRYQQIKPYLLVHVQDVKKIALNKATVVDLSKHPYIRYKYAQRIVRYREQHGPFRSLDDLLDIVLIDAVYLRKIAPYLTIDHD